MQSHFSLQSARDLLGGSEERNTPSRDNHPGINFRSASMEAHMTGLVTVCLLLVLPLSCPQISLQSETGINAHPAAGAPPPPPSPHIRVLLRNEETSHLNAKQTYAHVDGDNANARVALFTAAAMGTAMVMAAVYCIYNRFYTRHQYLHTQLHDHSELTVDSVERHPHGPAGPGVGEVRRSGYGSLSDSPSIISVPPSLSPPPSVVPFPPLFLSSRALRTISAKDLEKCYI